MKRLLNFVFLLLCAFAFTQTPPSLSEGKARTIFSTKAQLRRAMTRNGFLTAQPISMAAAPVSTVSATATLTGQTLQRNDNRLRYFGRTRDNGTTYNSYGIGPNRGTSSDLDIAWGPEFNFYGQAIEFKLVEFGQIRLWCDGQVVETITTPANATQFRKWDFGSVANRRLRLQLWSTGLMEVRCGAADTIMPVIGALAPRMVVFGDSYAAGTQQTGPTITRPMSSWAQSLGRMLGVDADCQGYGGTGFLNNNGTTGADFVSRFLLDVPPRTPDILIIAGGINDRTSVNAAYTSATRQAAASTLFAQAKSTCPNAFIVVIGTWGPTSASSSASDYTTVRDDLKAKALAYRLPFIDPLTGNVYDGTGTLVYTGASAWITAGNQSTFTGSVDNLHPNQAGHDYIAYRVASAIFALLDQPTPIFGMVDPYSLRDLNALVVADEGKRIYA